MKKNLALASLSIKHKLRKNDVNGQLRGTAMPPGEKKKHSLTQSLLRVQITKRKKPKLVEKSNVGKIYSPFIETCTYIIGARWPLSTLKCCGRP